jgi:hypothetical protein
MHCYIYTVIHTCKTLLLFGYWPGEEKRSSVYMCAFMQLWCFSPQSLFGARALHHAGAHGYVAQGKRRPSDERGGWTIMYGRVTQVGAGTERRACERERVM